MTRNPLERQSAEGMCAQLTLGHGAHEKLASAIAH